MLKLGKHLLFVLAVMSLFALNALAQDASRLYLSVDDHQGNSGILIYGNAVNATYYVDNGDSGLTTNYYESIAPPPPPDPSFDIRWKGIPGRNNAKIVDGLFPRDYRAVPVSAVQKDTFLIQFKNTIIGGSESMWFTWDDASELALRCDSAFFVYNDGSSNITIDMFAQNSVEVMGVGDNAITQARIYKYGCNVIDGVKDKPQQQTPVEFGIKPNYPNPFNPTTNISFDLAKSSTVDVSIFNVLGQKIATLVTGQLTAGEHYTVWNGTTQNGAPVSSGVYFVRMNAKVDASGEAYTALRKLLLMK